MKVSIILLMILMLFSCRFSKPTVHRYHTYVPTDTVSVPKRGYQIHYRCKYCDKSDTLTLYPHTDRFITR